MQLYQYDLNGDASSKTAVSLAGVTATVIDHAIELDFGTAGLGGNANTTAADGYYELDITAGGTTYKHFFYRLLGDVTGDGVVDNNDLNAIADRAHPLRADGLYGPERRRQRRRLGDGDGHDAGHAGQGAQAGLGPLARLISRMNGRCRAHAPAGTTVARRAADVMLGPAAIGRTPPSRDNVTWPFVRR